MAKIEIASRPIKDTQSLGKLAPQHLYIVHTKDNGEQIAYRGGPEGGDAFQNWRVDDLKVTQLPYIDGHPDWDNSEGLENSLHTRKVLATGSDLEINLIAERMSKQVDWINSQNFDYKLPTIGPWQNSNTVTRYLVEGVGLKFELPEYSDGKKVVAPAWDSILRHTSTDKVMKQIKVTSENYVHSMESDGPTSRFGEDLRMMYKINQLNKNQQCDIADNNKKAEEYGPPYVKAEKNNLNSESEHNKKDGDTYGPPYFGDSSGPSNPGEGPKYPSSPNSPRGGDFGGGSSPNVGNGGGGGSSSKWYESGFWEGAWTKGWSGESKLQHEFHGQSQQQSRHQSSSKSESQTDFRLAA